MMVIPYHFEESDDGHVYTATRRDSTTSYSTIRDVDQESTTSLPQPLNYNSDMEYYQQSCPSSNLQFYPIRIKRKSVYMTYLLTLFLGIVGGHHFYLGRPKFGTLYIFTAGLLGMGYVVDLVRVPWLVDNANLEILHPELRGRKYLVDAYLLWLPPFGFLGELVFVMGKCQTRPITKFKQNYPSSAQALELLPK